jgi:hypothetical protein
MNTEQEGQKESKQQVFLGFPTQYTMKFP